MILLFHAHSNRKALYLQPFHSTIKRYSQFKAGAIFGVLASFSLRGDNCTLMPCERSSLKVMLMLIHVYVVE